MAGLDAADHGERAVTSGHELAPTLWPWAGTADAEITVTVYVLTGRHGVLSVPESVCRECHLFVRAAEAAATQVDADVAVAVRSWWTHLPWALWYGGHQPPVLVVGDRRLCQGHDVPEPGEIVEAVHSVLAGR